MGVFSVGEFIRKSDHFFCERARIFVETGQCPTLECEPRQKKREVLARISHKLSTVEPQCHALTALHSVWVLNVLQARFRAQTFVRLAITQPLRLLATKVVRNAG